MLVEGNAWYWYEYAIGMIGENYMHIVKGDSTINGIVYKKLLGTSGGNDPLLLREDTVEKKVYHYNVSSEELVYDFSLVPGDTFYIGGYRALLQSITDTISHQYYSSTLQNLVLSINSPKVFTLIDLDREGFEYIWIEGIGSVCGLGFYPCLAFSSAYLLCHFDSTGKRNYHYFLLPKEKDSCKAYSSVGIETLSNINTIVSVYPNPANEKVTFSWELGYSHLPVKLKIFTFTGEMVQEREITRLESFWVWNTAQKESGIYFYILENKDSELLSQGKLVIWR
ncbi:MAG: T9SS type A sorting domain-containing protein [Bacteroidetes bacterium]|nr:T9SS type A sorting domain-containing protein [Bacteroidota bacterium]MCB0841667.1 T9SS type A sorting domain-containing protein [Bacteroidota bacterium]MCB0851025.1 T9SS type A sorting domain-containing protein [Bacteroidota bacterium]